MANPFQEQKGIIDICRRWHCRKVKNGSSPRAVANDRRCPNFVLGWDYSTSYRSRMRSLIIIVIASLALPPEGFAQSQIATLEDRVKAIDARMLTENDCFSQVVAANDSNSADLIYGGQVCAAVKKPVEASSLLLVGQMRAGFDIMLMPPATQADERSLVPLYGMLWAGGGLSGLDDDVMHDPGQRARFFDLFDRWSPSYSPAYNPGWNARKRPDAKLYASTITQAKADLRKELDRIVQLDSDDQYYALQREYSAILKRIPKEGLAADTPDSLRLDELRVQKRARGIALGVDMGRLPPDIDELSAAENASGSPRNDPPSIAGKDERVISGANDLVVDKCTDRAERIAVAGNGKISHRQVHTSGKWGTIFRAVIADGEFGPVRFTCTENFTGSEPVDVPKRRSIPR